MTRRHQLVVIGAGPGGYVAALRAAQLGLDVACVEREEALGGTCLRVGCIPSKALLESSERYREAREGLAVHGVRVGPVELDLAAMMRRKTAVVGGLTRGVDWLFRKHGIARYHGTGRLLAANRVRVEGREPVELEAERVLLATGSESAPLPGVVSDGERVVTSTEALAFDAVPAHLVVIGAGAIGLELGSVWARLGARVTVLEALERPLPMMDGELVAALQRSLERQGLAFRCGARVEGVRVEGGRARIALAGTDSLEAEKVLVAIGRRPVTEGLGLDVLGVARDRRGFVAVDAGFETNVPGLFAIGDLIGGQMLAHKAAEEGVACVERMVTGYGRVDRGAIPAVVYTEPELASVGRTEAELEAAGVPHRVGRFAFKASGRAAALGQTEGLAKVIAHRDTDRVLGVHLFGPRASELITEGVSALEFGASSEDLARLCHAHPTLSEVLKEAALAVAGRAIHG